MNKIILADSQAIFRAGTAKVLAMDEDMRIIAQCTDLDRLHHAISTFPGSIAIFAASMRPDFNRLRMLLDTTSGKGIVIAENNESASTYLQQGFRGVVFRNVNGPSLVECVQRVASGETWMPPQLMQVESPEEDMVGTRVRDRLTPKEMRIVALIVQGCKNREIASVSRPPSRSSRTTCVLSTTRPASAIALSSPCSPFTIACWRKPLPKWAPSSRSKSRPPRPPSPEESSLALVSVSQVHRKTKAVILSERGPRTFFRFGGGESKNLRLPSSSSTSALAPSSAAQFRPQIDPAQIVVKPPTSIFSATTSF